MAKRKKAEKTKVFPQFNRESDLCGCIAFVKNGHEKGQFCLIIGECANGMVVYADGQRRKVEKPKLKSVKHVDIHERNEEARAYICSGKLTNRYIRCILFDRRDYSAEG